MLKVTKCLATPDINLNPFAAKFKKRLGHFCHSLFYALFLVRLEESKVHFLNSVINFNKIMAVS
ncbi:hypothetical protein SAMN05660293_04037 [Dyadobacter psychrophilus]|uniref:Uncharacterized protein n=1 Tax=Dyadobacter psychrophilus TaxID=651661 RepID=A0A1T5GFM4_9BACT|nr:hypothetical protein SAMN05660293_04037 [Dyadobacter psychrophilus]